MSEAVDRYWTKKWKEYEEERERRRWARLGLQQPEVPRPKIEEAACENASSVADEVAKPTELTEAIVGASRASKPAPKPRTVPGPPVVRTCPLLSNSRLQGKGHSSGAADGRRWPLGGRRRFPL
jgi:hypothetical protein